MSSDGDSGEEQYNENKDDDDDEEEDQQDADQLQGHHAPDFGHHGSGRVGDAAGHGSSSAKPASARKRGTSSRKKKDGHVKPMKLPKRDPEAPKKPQTAFLMFMATIREKLKLEGFKGTTDQSSEAGKRWKIMSDEEKSIYQQMAEKDKARYKEQLKSYDGTAWKEMVERHKQEMKEKEEHEAGHPKRKKDPRAPKRALGAYFLFMNDCRESVKKQHPNATLGDLSKFISEMWKKMGPDEKKPYEDRAAAEKQRYTREMEEWKRNNPEPPKESPAKKNKAPPPPVNGPPEKKSDKGDKKANAADCPVPAAHAAILHAANAAVDDAAGSDDAAADAAESAAGGGAAGSAGGPGPPSTSACPRREGAGGADRVGSVLALRCAGAAGRCSGAHQLCNAVLGIRRPELRRGGRTLGCRPGSGPGWTDAVLFGSLQPAAHWSHSSAAAVPGAAVAANAGAEPARGAEWILHRNAFTFIRERVRVVWSANEPGERPAANRGHAGRFFPAAADVGAASQLGHSTSPRTSPSELYPARSLRLADWFWPGSGPAVLELVRATVRHCKPAAAAAAAAAQVAPKRCPVRRQLAGPAAGSRVEARVRRINASATDGGQRYGGARRLRRRPLRTSRPAPRRQRVLLA